MGNYAMFATSILGSVLMFVACCAMYLKNTPSRKRAYSKRWLELTDEEMNAALSLGYTENVWEPFTVARNDLHIPVNKKKWSDCTSGERDALTVIGFDSQSWDRGSG